VLPRVRYGSGSKLCRGRIGIQVASADPLASEQPAAVPHANHSVGLRTVAVLEAAKGILVLLLGFGVLALMHKNLDGALYLPGELYSLLRHPRPLKWAVVGANALIVLYMLILRVKAQRRRPVRAI
jgi:uncharacterized membrane protein (DUF2068 family)